MDFYKIFLGIIFGILGQVGSFMQLQGSIKYNLYEKYLWIILIFSIPISWFYIKSVSYFYEGFGGQIWPSRIIGFSIGIMVFTVFSILMFKEHFSLKTLICIILTISVLLIQLFWK